MLAALRLAFEAIRPPEAESKAPAAEAAPPEGKPGESNTPEELQTQQERALHQLLQRLNAALQEDAPPSAHANRPQGE